MGEMLMTINFNLWGNEPADDKIDFERINAIAMSNIETVLHRWLPDGTDILGVQRIGPDGEKKVNPGGILSGRVNLKH